MGEPQYFPLEGDSPQIYFFPHCTNKKTAERTISSFSRIKIKLKYIYRTNLIVFSLTLAM